MWIQQYITTVSYSVIVNDEVSGFFTPTRGLHLGDPLSPYLFFICMEVLTRALCVELTKKHSGIRFKISSWADKLPYLLFANYKLLFCRTNLESCQKLLGLLNNFCQRSWQLINFQKSSPIFSKNTSTHVRHVVSSVFNIKHQDNLGK